MIDFLTDEQGDTLVADWAKRAYDFGYGMLVKERLILAMKHHVTLSDIKVITFFGEEPPEDGKKGVPLYAIC